MRALVGLLLALWCGAAFAQPAGVQYGPGPCPFGASACQVTATGGTTARTLADRAADVRNVLDGANGIAGAKCDGTTNDNAAIQAVINAAAGHARVYIPNTGAACIVSRLTVPSNSHITIDGTLKLLPGANVGGGVLAADTGSPSNIVIDGHGILDGNQSQQSAGVQANIYLYQASYVWISGVTTQNSRNFPLNVVASSHVYVSRILSQNNVGSAEFAQGSFDCWIDQSEIASSTADYGFAFYGGVYNSGITNSLLHNNVADGVTVLNDAGQPAASHDIVIANNTIWANQAAGVGVRTNAGASAANYRISITGNVMTGNNLGGNAGWGGVYLYNANYVSVAQNIISKDGNATSASIGINLDPSVYYTTIQGNIVTDEGQGGTNGIGIQVNGPYQVVTGNIINDDQGSKTMAFAISGSPGVGTVVANNMVGQVISGTPVSLAYGAGAAYTQQTAYTGQQHISATIADSTLQYTGVTVASLGTCNAANKGATQVVTDATGPTYLGTLTGGGAVVTGALCNGSAWVAH